MVRADRNIDRKDRHTGTLGSNWEWAQAAVDYVVSRMNSNLIFRGSCTQIPLKERGPFTLSSPTGAPSCWCTEWFQQPLLEGLREKARDEQVKMMNHAGEVLGCGNCGVQAAMAFTYLENHGFQSIEYMRFANTDHAYVVIGRVQGSRIEDPSTWGPYAVVCDPWRNEVYLPSELDGRNRATETDPPVFPVLFWRKGDPSGTKVGPPGDYPMPQMDELPA